MFCLVDTQAPDTVINKDFALFLAEGGTQYYIDQCKLFYLLDTTDGIVETYTQKEFYEIIKVLKIKNVNTERLIFSFTRVKNLFYGQLKIIEDTLVYRNSVICTIKDSTVNDENVFIIDFYNGAYQIVEGVKGICKLVDFFITDIEWFGDIFIVTFIIESNKGTKGLDCEAIMQCVFDKEKYLGVFAFNSQNSFLKHRVKDYDIFIKDKQLRAKLSLQKLRINITPFVFV